MKDSFNYPLMEENVNREDVNVLIDFLRQDPLPQFTNGPKVKEFELEWGKWLGSSHNVMVGSGSMANEITLLILKYLYPEGGEIILTSLGWVSDISSILLSGFTPIFCDINPRTLSVDTEDFKKKITSKTRALLLVHILGFNGLNDEILSICKNNNIKLIEDVCESHGATFKGKKLGTFGDISNFSYFFAHHLCSLSEGGMICMENREMYELSKCLRSHGMLRESSDQNFKNNIQFQYPNLNKDFIFISAAHNGRSQEVNAVVALNQLKRLDLNNQKRISNFNYFIKNLDSNKFYTDFEMSGQCNYAFTIVLKDGSFEKRDLVEETLETNLIQFRRGLSGGGSMLRQPFLKQYVIDNNINFKDFPNVEYISDFSWYVGNYPSLEKEKIDKLISILNDITI